MLLPIERFALVKSDLEHIDINPCLLHPSPCC